MAVSVSEAAACSGDRPMCGNGDEDTDEDGGIG
jgi:hypothetical protein